MTAMSAKAYDLSKFLGEDPSKSLEDILCFIVESDQHVYKIDTYSEPHYFAVSIVNEVQRYLSYYNKEPVSVRSRSILPRRDSDFLIQHIIVRKGNDKDYWEVEVRLDKWLSDPIENCCDYVRQTYLYNKKLKTISLRDSWGGIE